MTDRDERLEAPATAWKPGDPVPESEYIRISPSIIRPDPILGNIRHVRDITRQEDLNASVAEEGLLQPIAVRFLGLEAVPVPVLVWGSRRLEAILRAGLEEVVVRNLGPLPDREALLFQFLENDQHARLHPVDEALATARLVRLFSNSQAEVARRIRRSEATVSILRRAGDALERLKPEELEEVYASGAFSVRTFSALVSTSRSAEELAWRILELARSRNTRTPGRPRGRRAGPAFQAVKNERGGGERFSVRWRDADLARDPVRFMESLTDFLVERLETVAKRAERLRKAHPSSKTASSVPEAKKATLQPISTPETTRPEPEKDDLILDGDFKRFDELLAQADARIAAVRQRLRSTFEDTREKGKEEGFNG